MVRSLAYFALMSLIWGLTWAAMKFGLRDLPPLLLAAVHSASDRRKRGDAADRRPRYRTRARSTAWKRT